MNMSSGPNYRNTISRDEINALPQGQFGGRIHLIDTIQRLKILENSLDHKTIFGFDTETKPSFKKGRTHNVALIQLATSNDAFLIRINKTGIPAFLVDIFEDEKIAKIGLALKDDIHSLRRLKKFEPAGFIDLQQYVKQFSIEDNGLKKLAANILGIKISKRQQTSNWEKEILDSEQLAYAATDAWVCHEIYLKLQNQYGNQG